MRTTIEMTDEHRAALLELAARRGLKGFSSLVEDAIASYLAAESTRHDKRRAAARLRGVLTKDEARAFRARTAALRGEWR
jgi:metal-responsive CopG/Arc/MetJ family transcriptional regulator